ncbi:pIIIa [Mastadenovirus porcusquartum]|uniref:PIIIa n=1 Tax=Mastadenovirus porcusquartum TaxID=3241439 RepID=A0A5P9VIJ1_9ADEN|nr:pIIIa [Porcine mastadenovirus B]QFX65719.1 pIIIa [Porcine mastadenovirus B]
MANPVTQASLQARPSANQAWDETFKRLMSVTGRGNFKNLPRASRFDAILETVVPSRHDPTHEKVLAVVDALVTNGAIRQDEAGQLFDALLMRVSHYNSFNVQGNLDRLVRDVKEAVSAKERSSRGPQIGSLVALNGFLSTLPATVSKGQDDYVAFLGALRLLVTEAPQTEVYKSGSDYFLQTSRQGAQTVNLTSAFDNLQDLWGVRSPQLGTTSVSSLLSPNTRLLLLMVAPFTDSISLSRDSYLGYLLNLYRETLAHRHVDEQTFNEVAEVSRAMGEENVDNLRSTLNFLLTNNQRRHNRHDYTLTPEEERILRYVQQSVSLFLMQDGATPSGALDLTSANMDTSLYTRHRLFINRLMDYLHRAAAMSPDYFTSAVLNPHWLPPEGFFTGHFEIPEPEDLYDWDATGDELAPFVGQAKTESEAPRSLQSHLSMPSLGSLWSLSSRRTVASRPVSRASSVRAATPEDFRELLREPENKNRNAELGLDSLADRFNRTWQTYRQEQEGASYRPRRLTGRVVNGELVSDFEDDDEGSEAGLAGSGNPFAHLCPRGF